MENKTALVVGASGLIGRECLYTIFNDDYYGKVIALVRKPLAIKNEKLVQVVINFDKIDDYAATVQADDIYCCLGTTIKTAGSKEAFKKVDCEYPVHVAQAAKNNGTQKFILVSSIGANEHSGNFYLKTKGEVQKAIEKISFNTFIIMQPSMLLGNRTEFRLGELIAKKIMWLFSFLFIGPLKKYKAIYAWQVAKAMVRLAKEKTGGNYTYESHKIREIADFQSNP